MLEFKKKTISLSGHLEFGLIPKNIIDFSKQDLFIHIFDNEKYLGIFVGKKEFLSTSQDSDCFYFEDGMCFSLNNDEQRVALFRIENQLEIKNLKKEF